MRVISFEMVEDEVTGGGLNREGDTNDKEQSAAGNTSNNTDVMEAATTTNNYMLAMQHNCSGSYTWTMAALETGIKINAQLVLLQEPTSKWGIRHPGYRLIWPHEGGENPRTMVGLFIYLFI
jgi:hypothetical protein